MIYRLQQLIRTTYQTYRTHGIQKTWQQIWRWFHGERGYFRQVYTTTQVDYQMFVAQTTPTAYQLDVQRKRSRAWDHPHFDILLISGHRLQFTVASVKAQSYQTYTLHILNDPAQPVTLTGDYVFPLQVGDQLAPDTLYMLAVYLRNHPQTQALTIDQDRIDERNLRTDPWLKPVTTLGNTINANPMQQGCIFSRSIWEPYALIERDAFTLRLIRESVRVRHMSGVRLHRNDTSMPITEHDDLIDHLTALGMRGVSVYDVDGVRRIDTQLEHIPLVSIVIPSKDHPDLIGACLHSLFSITDYPHYEVIIVDNDSQHPEVRAIYDQYHERDNFHVIAYDESFNFSRACNVGAAHARGEQLLFLNNDTLVLHADWLERMVRWFAIQSIGIVGAKLLYPDGTIQHAGVAFGMIDIAEHLFLGANENTMTAFGHDNWYRSVSAVTGACLMIDHNLYNILNGFDEAYQLLYSDLDLCLRVRGADQEVLYAPDVRLVHYESQSHSRRVPLADLNRAKSRFGHYLTNGDPLYHAYLSRRSPIPILALPEDQR